MNPRGKTSEPEDETEIIDSKYTPSGYPPVLNPRRGIGKPLFLTPAETAAIRRQKLNLEIEQERPGSEPVCEKCGRLMSRMPVKGTVYCPVCPGGWRAK